MNSIKKFFILNLSVSILLSILLLSCEYAPDEVNYKDIVVTEPDVLITVLNENHLNAMRGEVIISLNVDYSDHKHRGMRVYLSDTIVSGYLSGNHYKFNSTDFPDGRRILTIAYFVSSNTGSLADKLDAEVFVIQKQYEVLIYNGAIESSAITNLIVKDNALRVSWTKFNYPGFQKYILYKGNQKVAEISDINQTECVDLSYTGSREEFQIGVEAFGEIFFSDKKVIDNPKLNFISAEVVNNYRSVKLKWERCQYDSAFKNYNIYNSFDTITITDINQTELIDDNPPFGENVRYYVNVTPVVGKPYLYPKYIETTIGKTFWWDGRNPLLGYNTDKKEFVVFYLGFFLKYNAQTLDLIDSTRLNSANYYDPYQTDGAFSNDGKVFYMHKDLTNFIIQKVDLETFQYQNTVSLKKYVPESSVRLVSTALSDNNILAFHYRSSSEGKTKIIDLAADQLIGELTHVEQGDLNISSDGKYLIFSSKVYVRENGFYKLAGIFPRDVYYSAPIFINEKTSANYINGHVNITNLENFTAVRQIPTGFTQSNIDLDYDKSTGYLGVVEHFGFTRRYKIFDISTGALKKAIPFEDYCSTVIDYHFQNGYFFGNRKAIPINY